MTNSISKKYMPPFIFKFRSVTNDKFDAAESIILQNQLWFASSLSFNDPFDCAPVRIVEGNVFEREKFYFRIFRSAYPDLDKDDLSTLVQQALRLGPEEENLQQDEVQAESRASFGVCSFTAEMENILLWSHYADAHRGLCFCFRSQGVTSPFSYALPVEYSNDRPVLNPVKAQVSDFLQKAVLTKAAFWSYEREYRLIRTLGPGTCTFPPEYLSGVIFGCQMAPEDRSRIIDLLARRRTPIQIWQARPSRREFKLQFEKVEPLSN